MEYGIQYLYWRKNIDCKSYIPYVEKAKNVGFDVLELGDYLVLEMSEAEVKELKAATENFDIKLTAGIDPPKDCSLTDLSKTAKDRGIKFYTQAFKRLQKL